MDCSKPVSSIMIIYLGETSASGKGREKKKKNTRKTNEKGRGKQERRKIDGECYLLETFYLLYFSSSQRKKDSVLCFL